MRDSKPQHSKHQHKTLKVTRNVTNRDKHMNEASTQFSAAISSKYHVNTRKVCFPIGRFVTMFSMYELMTIFCVL